MNPVMMAVVVASATSLSHAIAIVSACDSVSGVAVNGAGATPSARVTPPWPMRRDRPWLSGFHLTASEPGMEVLVCDLRLDEAELRARGPDVGELQAEDLAAAIGEREDLVGLAEDVDEAGAALGATHRPGLLPRGGVAAPRQRLAPMREDVREPLLNPAYSLQKRAYRTDRETPRRYWRNHQSREGRETGRYKVPFHSL